MACISNDPSFELNPNLGRSINLDAFEPLVRISKDLGVERFIYASSSSVYGIKEEKNVHEDMTLEPLTDYSKFKAECEVVLKKYQSSEFTTTTIRPATVCGYSPSMRLDFSVNALTFDALKNNKINVFGGKQIRPNLNMKDMINVYLFFLNKKIKKNKEIKNIIFNVGFENISIINIAKKIKKLIKKNCKISIKKSNDPRSYRQNSEKLIKNGYKQKYNIEDAVIEIKKEFLKNKVLNDKKFYRINTLKIINKN